MKKIENIFVAKKEMEEKIFDESRGKKFITIIFDNDEIYFRTTCLNRVEVYFAVMEIANQIINGKDLE